MILKSVILHSVGEAARRNELLREVSNLKSGDFALFGELPVAGYSNLNDSALFGEIVSNLKPGAFAALCLARGGRDEIVIFSHLGEVYSRAKTALFTPNGEDEKFSAGDASEVRVFEIGGVKFGALICFELRFTALWRALESADVILVPAMWGAGRGEQFEILVRALALQNRCYVVATSDLDFKFERVVAPNGEKLGKSAEFDPGSAKNFAASLGLIQI